MGDYTNAKDLQNNKDFGFGSTLDQFNKLADMLQKKSAQSQQSDQFQQKQSEQSDEFGKTLQQPFDLANQKDQIAQEAQSRNLGLAQKTLNENGGPGGSMNVKIGDVDLTHKEDSPLKYLLKSQQQGAKAMSHANDIYNKQLPDVQKRMQSASEGLEAMNDPNAIGSIGQAKTLMIKNLGMNRYNSQEGNALVPQQFSQVFHEMYNGVTGGDDNPMSDSQRRAINTVFQNSLSMARQQHEMAKSSAVQSYHNSGYADPTQEAQLKGNLGVDFDKRLNDTTERFKQAPSNPGYQPPAPGSQAAKPSSWADTLSSFLHPGARSPQQSSPQAAPAQGGAPMSFKEFQAKKAAGQL